MKTVLTPNGKSALTEIPIYKTVDNSGLPPALGSIYENEMETIKPSGFLPTSVLPEAQPLIKCEDNDSGIFGTPFLRTPKGTRDDVSHSGVVSVHSFDEL